LYVFVALLLTLTGGAENAGPENAGLENVGLENRLETCGKWQT